MNNFVKIYGMGFLLVLFLSVVSSFPFGINPGSGIILCFMECFAKHYGDLSKRKACEKDSCLIKNPSSRMSFGPEIQEVAIGPEIQEAQIDSEKPKSEYEIPLMGFLMCSMDCSDTNKNPSLRKVCVNSCEDKNPPSLLSQDFQQSELQERSFGCEECVKECSELAFNHAMLKSCLRTCIDKKPSSRMSQDFQQSELQERSFGCEECVKECNKLAFTHAILKSCLEEMCIDKKPSSRMAMPYFQPQQPLQYFY